MPNTPSRNFFTPPDQAGHYRRDRDCFAQRQRFAQVVPPPITFDEWGIRSAVVIQVGRRRWVCGWE